MGKYGKGHLNESGKLLLEICMKYDLVLTNTLFKHKLSHRTTWTAPYRSYQTHDGTNRRNPVRNQIFFLIIRNNFKHLVQDSRSYSGTETDSDHKMVLCKIDVDLRKIYKKKKTPPKVNILSFAKKRSNTNSQML